MDGWGPELTADYADFRDLSKYIGYSIFEREAFWTLVGAGRVGSNWVGIGFGLIRHEFIDTEEHWIFTDALKGGTRLPGAAPPQSNVQSLLTSNPAILGQLKGMLDAGPGRDLDGFFATMKKL